MKGLICKLSLYEMSFSEMAFCERVFWEQSCYRQMQLRFDRHSVRESVVSASADCALVGNSCGVCPNKEVEREVTLQQPLRLLY